MRILPLATVFGLCFVLWGCDLKFSSQPAVVGDGSIGTKEISLKPFSKLVIEGNISVQDEQRTDIAMIRTDKNLLDNFEFIQSGEQLTIRPKQSFRASGSVEIYVNTQKLKDLELVGSGSFTSYEDRRADSMQIAVSGSGTCSVQGQLGTANLKVTGSGEIQIEKVKKAIAKVTGSGSIFLDPIESLEAEITGSGSIHYKHNPALSVNQSVVGSGEVIRER